MHARAMDASRYGSGYTLDVVNWIVNPCRSATQTCTFQFGWLTHKTIANTVEKYLKCTFLLLYGDI
jgi:hypothetical protein